jgi:hypothetical protein
MCGWASEILQLMGFSGFNMFQHVSSKIAGAGFRECPESNRMLGGYVQRDLLGMMPAGSDEIYPYRSTKKTASTMG